MSAESLNDDYRVEKELSLLVLKTLSDENIPEVERVLRTFKPLSEKRVLYERMNEEQRKEWNDNQKRYIVKNVLTNEHLLLHHKNSSYDFTISEEGKKFLTMGDHKIQDELNRMWKIFDDNKTKYYDTITKEQYIGAIRSWLAARSDYNDNQKRLQSNAERMLADLFDGKSLETIDYNTMRRALEDNFGSVLVRSLKRKSDHNFWNRELFIENGKLKDEFRAALEEMSEKGEINLQDWRKFKIIEKETTAKTVTKEKNNSSIPVLEDQWNTKGTTMQNNIELNTILYGPPGTGKTYNLARYAVAIIDNIPIEELHKSMNEEEVKKRFAELKESGQIESTTFHQSYGYEEFIEGIKPVMDSAGGGENIEYRVMPGVFKRFCELAAQPVMKDPNAAGMNHSPTVWKVSLDGTGDNDVRTECLQNGHIRIGWDEYGPKIDDQTVYDHGGKNVLNAFISKMKIGDIVLSCYSNTTIDAIGFVTGEYEWHDDYDRLKRLRTVRWIVKDIREDITEANNGAAMTLSTVYKMSVTPPDVLAMIKSHLSEADMIEPNEKRYVFLIDEINRGNISKIFGEPITLIEESKRVGAEEETTVRLPYSQKMFGVPGNVYLVGTMNTADRSIAMIDTALRRRFQFKEMLPKPSLLNGVTVDGLDIAEMLKSMNQKISILYDREHTVGHAYLLPLIKNPSMDKLADIFRNKIIPLLQEYFFEDYEKIRVVLGDNKNDDNKNIDSNITFITRTKQEPDKFFGQTDLDMEASYTYDVNEEAFNNIESYKSI